jgi:polynucleotide 5'-kinase involved in rRNA processing
MTMTAQQKADRLALIATIAEKRNAAANFKSKVQTKTSKARKSRAVSDRKSERTSSLDSFYKNIDKMDENHNQWTDASKYANEYYGETYRATTKFDNDWG